MYTVRNEAIRTKWNEERHVTGNRRTAIKMVGPRHANAGVQNCWTGCRTAPAKEKEAQRQSRRGMAEELGTARKEETRRVKNASVYISGRKKLYLWVEENSVFAEKKIAREYFP
jgi:hypothetical protein